LQGFDALYLMTTAIRSSTAVLFWAFVLLVVVQAMLALMINQILEFNFFNEDSISMEKRLRMFTYFGTFSRSFLTMFEITLGNWGPIARLLTEDLSMWCMIFSLSHKLSIGFAIIGVINGVFISETFKVASNDDAVMMMTKKRAAKNHAKKMEMFFKNADISEDGWVDKQEFNRVLKNPTVQHWLQAQEIDASDADVLFFHLDNNHDERISAMDLVQGVAKLKGAARNLDMTHLFVKQEELTSKMDKNMLLMQETVSELREHIISNSRHIAKHGSLLQSFSSFVNSQTPETDGLNVRQISVSEGTEVAGSSAKRQWLL
jgi:hypothetical protein